MSILALMLFLFALIVAFSREIGEFCKKIYQRPWLLEGLILFGLSGVFLLYKPFFQYYFWWLKLIIKQATINLSHSLAIQEPFINLLFFLILSLLPQLSLRFWFQWKKQKPWFRLELIYALIWLFLVFLLC